MPWKNGIFDVLAPLGSVSRIQRVLVLSDGLDYNWSELNSIGMIVLPLTPCILSCLPRTRMVSNRDGMVRPSESICFGQT